MRTRPAVVTTFLLVALLGITFASSVFTKAKNADHKSHGKVVSQLKTLSPQIQSDDIPGTIDGKTSPDSIPDRVAYSALFGALTHNDKVFQKHLRPYLSQILAACQTCNTSQPQNSLTQAERQRVESDIDTFIEILSSFEVDISILDAKVKEIKDMNWPTPSQEVMNQLAEYQKQKDSLVDSTISTVFSELSSEGIQNLRDYVQARLKRQLKMIPGPTGPPGTPGWSGNGHGEKHH